MRTVTVTQQFSKLSRRTVSLKHATRRPFSKTSARWIRPIATVLVPPKVNASGFPNHSLDTMTRINTIACRLFSTAVVAEEAEDDESPSNSNVIPFLLSDIGEGIAEVEILQWYVQKGDHVREFDPICEVQSDKATVEIPSRYEGTIAKLEGEVGDMIQTGSPLFYIETTSSSSAAGSSVSSPEAIRAPPTRPSLNNRNTKEDAMNIPPPKPSPTPENQATVSGKFLASPAVRKLGRDHGLDLSALTGTGPKGRVLKADVLKVIGVLDTSDESTAPSASDSTGQDQVAADGDDDGTIVPIRGYNRLMIKSMTESLQIPHMGYGDEVNMNALQECRQAAAAATPTDTADQPLPNPSVLVYCIKATSLALKEYPQLNSTICTDSTTLRQSASHHIGIAMDTPRGLAVPVIQNVERLSLLEIAAELQRLKALAQDATLSEKDVSAVQATFSLSNIGAVGGGTYMSPVVAPPQVAIGAMGKIQRLPRFRDDDSLEVEAAHIMNISWAADHRAVDGATLARFSNTWKAYLESPTTMMMRMK